MRHDMAGVYPPPRPAPFLAEGGEHRGGRDKQAPNLQTKTLSPRMVGAGGDEWNDRDSASELHGGRRSGDWMDFAANSLGATLGAVVGIGVLVWRATKRGKN